VVWQDQPACSLVCESRKLFISFDNIPLVMKKLIPAMFVLILIAMVGCFQETPQEGVGDFIRDEVIVTQSGGQALLIQDCYDQGYIEDNSDYIIEGAVEGVQSAWNSDNTSIMTYTNVLIEKYDKGSPFAEKILKIVTPGGTVGNISQAVEDQPLFQKGKKIIVYMKLTDVIKGEYSIVCGARGVQDIASD